MSKDFIRMHNDFNPSDIICHNYVEVSPSSLVSGLIEYIGEDADREGLKDTPKRYVKFLNEFLKVEEPKITTFDNDAGSNDIVLVKDIPFYSLCEHHIIPFFGTASVAYIPFDKIIGISKIPRIVDYFSRRLQNQERITSQVAEYLFDSVSAKGVAVKLTARHMCMEMRGIKAHDANTDTLAFRGEFSCNYPLQDQFLNLIK